MSRRIWAGVLVILALAGIPAQPTAHAAVPTAVGVQALPSLAPMLKETTPAVVNIATRGRVRMQQNPLLSDPFFRRFFNLPSAPHERQTQSVGSGVIIDGEQGFVLTNHHVVANANQILVTMRDRRQFIAELVGTDPDTDIAVLKIPPENLSTIAMGDSDKLEVGDFVVAIGNPFGIGQTVTSGIVSALRRSGLGIEGFEDFIQTDASINPGNSGGALVTLDGKLIGINTAIIGPGGGNVGIGFAIPINMAREIMDQLVVYGEVRRGRLGVRAQDLTPEIAVAMGVSQSEGAIITRIAPGSPAAKAGLKAGDVVIDIDGEAVRSATHLRNKIGVLRVGGSIELKVLRDGDTHTIRAKIEEPRRLQVEGSSAGRRLSGATFGPLTEKSPLFGRIEGISVADVERASPAWRTGLRKGDVIVAVNRQPVPDLEAFKATVQAGGGALLLNVQRGEAQVYIVIR